MITELVLNHTSDEHPWFQRARRVKPGSRERDFYVWSDIAERYDEARIIFKDFERSNWTWDPVAGAYFWHRFYSHQPDLNFDNPLVRRAMFQVVDFWLGLGVDGLRLDAVPYLFERGGTNCENLPETFEFLTDLRRHIDRKFSARMLLAEANQWPEDALRYLEGGDKCQYGVSFSADAAVVHGLPHGGPISDRRHSRSDVSAAGGLPVGVVPSQPRLSQAWYRWSSAAFLRAYFQTCAGAPFVPGNPEERRVLLDFFLLEKALYEVAYELNHRPTWLRIPLRGINEVLADGPDDV